MFPGPNGESWLTVSGIELFIDTFFHALIQVLIVVFFNFRDVRRGIKTDILLLISIFTGLIIIKKAIPAQGIQIPFVVLILFACIYLIYKLNVIESLAIAVTSVLIVLIGELCILTFLFNILESLGENRFFVIIIVNLFILLFTGMIIVLKQSILTSRHKSKINIKLSLFVCILFLCNITTLNIAFMNRASEMSAFTVIVFNLTATTIYFSISLFLIFIYFYSNNQKNLLEQQKREYEHLMEYTGMMEELYENIRNQKHDFLNVLLSIKSYAENGQVEEIRDYFSNLIPNEYSENKPNAFFSSLNMIKHAGLKGILTYKLNHASSIGIKVYVNIFSKINIHTMTPFDLSRVIGILADNAIEAAYECKDKEIHIGIEIEEPGISIIISNPYRYVPNLEQIFKRGVSTKGKSRGLGLYNVRKILSQYPEVQLKTTVQNNMFFQELILPE